jgi:hypothetical protein
MRRALARLSVPALLACVLASNVARAAAEEDEIDDPKVSRRLGTRMTWTSPAGAAAPVAPSAPAVSRAAGVAEERPSASSGDALPGISATASRPESEWSPSLPHVKLAFRRFDFVRIGASNSSDGTAAPESFNSLSLDVYPISSLLRVGLSSQYGWQSGTWVAGGDYFLAQSASLGVQKAWNHFVPFAEVFAGVGYMRRVQFDRTTPTGYWQMGFDVGTEVYVGRLGYLSAAIGYLHPVNGFVRGQEFLSIFVDTWSFKLGIGL